MYNKKKKIKHKTLKIFCLLIGTIVTAVFLEAGILYIVNSKNVYKTSKVLLDQTIEIIERNKQSEVRNIIADIPVYKGIALYVVDKKTGRIYGATDTSKIGVKLDDMGLRKQRKKVAKEKITSGIIRVDGEKNYYILKKTQKYIVGVTYCIAVDNKSNLIAILIMVVYLSIAAVGILFMVLRLSKVKKKNKEQSVMLSSISEMSNTDKMTGCLNRKAYDEDISEIPMDSQFIYVSMDVNGLKIINDRQGHAAGDELICIAASCMKTRFDKYGKVYRMGGDEFAAILFVKREQFEWIRRQFDGDIKYWRCNRIKELSISYGYVSSSECQWDSMKEISDVADIRMYEEKAMYYKKNGVDRQGQPASYLALYRLYTQILRINLEKDRYKILNWEETKNKKKQDAIGALSEWFHNFEDIRLIHSDDLVKYLGKTKIEYLKKQFANKKKFVTITYRRKEGDGYKRITLEIIPEDESSQNTYEGFLYVKE